MTFYVVRFEHPDEQGWRSQLPAHLAWLREHVADGAVRASGPLPGAPDRAALLIMAATDRASVEGIIATDPFAIHGLIENMTIDEWDPLFGVWAAESSMPGLATG